VKVEDAGLVFTFIAKMAFSLSLALVAVAPALLVYLYSRLRYFRLIQYRHLPQFEPSLLWGHLKIINDFLQRGDPSRHIGTL
jgi:hypothetical protein